LSVCSLLNILAGRITGGHGGKSLQGEILSNGERVKPVVFRNRVAYVTQDDALLYVFNWNLFNIQTDSLLHELVQHLLSEKL
jgi:ABC-type molybdate transport system ATPase subunit